MWTTRLRYSGLGLLLAGSVVGLLVAWRVNHVLFGTIVGSIAFIALSVALLMVARDGWRQTSPDNLSSRGFVPESVKGVTVMDPGLRREYAPIIPAAVSRRISGNPRPRPAAAAAAKQEPARRGQSRRRKETLQPDATVSLVDERRAAGIDDLFLTV